MEDKKKVILVGAGESDSSALIESTKQLEESGLEVIEVDKDNIPDIPEYLQNSVDLDPVVPYLHPEDFMEEIPKKLRGVKVHPVRTEIKQQRNDSCLCGSGKKYKNCCLKNKK